MRDASPITMAALSIKTRLLNCLRLIFQAPWLERGLRQLVNGRPLSARICKLVPSNYLYPQPSLRRIRRAGLILDLDISDYIDHGIYFGFLGTEEQSYRALISLIEPHFNCIDVGANNGFLSLLMTRAAKLGRVASFEPDPRNYKKASRNIALNQTPNLLLCNYGLGCVSGVANMVLPQPGNTGGCRIASTSHKGTPILIKPLDDCFASLGLHSLNLIKIDVEGFELNVLRGAKGTLLRYRPILFVEVDDANLREQGDSAAALLRYLREVGYNSFIRASDGRHIGADFSFHTEHFDLIARTGT